MTYCSTGHLAQAALEKEKKDRRKHRKGKQKSTPAVALFDWKRFFKKKEI